MFGKVGGKAIWKSCLVNFWVKLLEKYLGQLLTKLFEKALKQPVCESCWEVLFGKAVKNC